jgi:hypothetical protein
MEGTQIAADIATVVGAGATVAAAVGGIGVLWFTYRQLVLNTRQLRLNADAQTATFWLQLREMFARHDEVHGKLTPRGEWWDYQGKLEEQEGGDRYEVPWAGHKVRQEGDRYVVPWTMDEVIRTPDDLKRRFDSLPGPDPPERDPEAWSKVEAYMGLFEHCESMLRNELIDLATFKEIYRYRLLNIMSNRKIVIAKLGCHRDDWQGFVCLLKRVGITVPPAVNLKVDELCDNPSYETSFGTKRSSVDKPHHP